MDRNEILNEMKMTYKELVAYLLNKYGSAKYDYFRTESCKSKNPKNSRGKEGLDCHHIDEDKAILLANPRHALKNPFAYQKADRLVYCNHLEHFLLHVKIVEEPRNSQANERELPGIGGAVNFLCPQLNDIYNGYVYTREFMFSFVNEQGYLCYIGYRTEEEMNKGLERHKNDQIVKVYKSISEFTIE